MRIDPAAILAHTTASIPVRTILAGIVMTAGCLTPTLIGHGLEGIEDQGGVLAFSPFFLVLNAMLTDSWPLSVTLLFILAWRTVVFARGEGLNELFWIYVLPFLMSSSSCGDAEPLAWLLVALGIGFFLCHQRRLGRE